MRKVATSSKKVRLIIDNEKQDPFKFVFDCDVKNALLIPISLNNHETLSYFILYSCKEI